MSQITGWLHVQKCMLAPENCHGRHLVFHLHGCFHRCSRHLVFSSNPGHPGNPGRGNCQFQDRLYRRPHLRRLETLLCGCLQVGIRASSARRLHIRIRLRLSARRGKPQRRKPPRPGLAKLLRRKRGRSRSLSEKNKSLSQINGRERLLPLMHWTTSTAECTGEYDLLWTRLTVCGRGRRLLSTTVHTRQQLHLQHLNVEHVVIVAAAVVLIVGLVVAKG